jgi:hypothetical protein
MILARRFVVMFVFPETRGVTLAQIAGFHLYMIRAVLSGRGGQVIDLAKSNPFR